MVLDAWDDEPTWRTTSPRASSALSSARCAADCSAVGTPFCKFTRPAEMSTTGVAELVGVCVLLFVPVVPGVRDAAA